MKRKKLSRTKRAKRLRKMRRTETAEAKRLRNKIRYTSVMLYNLKEQNSSCALSQASTKRTARACERVLRAAHEKGKGSSMKIGTRLAMYSVLYKRKSPTAKVRTSAKAIKEAYANGVPFDLEVCDMSSPYDGSYTSPKELKEQGHTQVMIRFNADRDVMILDL